MFFLMILRCYDNKGFIAQNLFNISNFKTRSVNKHLLSWYDGGHQTVDDDLMIFNNNMTMHRRKGTTARFIEDQDEKREKLVQFFCRNIHNKWD